jgi:large subunit ribosomal protein L25
MATVSLNATSRTDIGKGPARKVRAQGMIPAVIYRAGSPATSITINPHEIENAFRSTGNRNTLVDIDVGGTNFVCLVKATQRDPVNARLMHIDFFQVDDNETVDVSVPVTTTGKAAGVTAGGRLQIIVRDLNIRCKPGDIPDAVPVDVTEMIVGDFVRVSEINAPGDSEIIAPNDYNVIAVLGKRLELEVEAPVVEGDEDGAEADGEEGSDADADADADAETESE